MSEVSFRRRAIALLVSVSLLATLISAVFVFRSRTAGAASSNLFFSEYIEGSSNNKALEIYNATGTSIDLAANGYNLQFFFNGSTTAGATINLTGSVANGDVYVVANAAAVASVLAQADLVPTASWYNGDDAIVLRQGSTIIDSIGQVGFDPGTTWGTGLNQTLDRTLQRQLAICTGDPVSTDLYDPSVGWNGFAIDTFTGLGAHTSTCLDNPPGDLAPTVTSTIPANGAANVTVSANVSVTFSEPVDTNGSWYSITCATSGIHPATVTGGPTTFSIDPSTDFAPGESCTLNIAAIGVTDQDTNDPPNAMVSDVSVAFTTSSAVCGSTATPIHQIQGSAASSPLVGQIVTTEGIVTADYQGTNQLGGYYVQSAAANADANAATSEGLYVFDTTNPVTVGDAVRVQGTVTEFVSSGITLTELTSVTSVQVCSTGNTLPSATTVTLPVSALTDWESVEGMLVTISQGLTVTETFTLGRFGEVSLSINGRLFNPTNVVEPGAPALALQDLNNRSRILLDDANSQQNTDPTLYPSGGLSATNTLRIGDTLPSVTGVLEQRFGVYRLQPVGPIAFTPSNPRPASPNVPGSLKVVAFNVLNYFNGDGAGGGFPTARGANTPAEFTRQRAKIISAMTALNADVYGLMELENDATNTAIEDLVSGLNAATAPGTFSFINTGVIGTDQIRVGIIYRPSAVTPAGVHKIINTSVDPRFIDTKNRPSLAQTFQSQNGARFTVVVNHLKSKGSDCLDVADPDTGDGQGNCNLTRKKAAEAIVDWLATDPTGSGDPDYLVIGDLNAYAKEDPVDVFTNAGYVNTIAANLGADAYSFVFSGQSGYLDHALASPSLASQIAGVAEWHANADEPIVLDYNLEFKSVNHQTTLYSSGPYRSSDHDPVVVGMNLTAPAPAGDLYVPVEPQRLLDTRPTPIPTGGTINLTVTGVAGVPANATAVSLNVAAVGPPGAAGHLRVWPAGLALPNASVLNFAIGKNTPNHVVVKVGAGGQISIYDGGSTSVIVDINGYWIADDPTKAGYTAVATPTRIVNAPLAPLTTIDVDVVGAGGIGEASEGVVAVVVNVGAISPTIPGHLRVWPTGTPMPNASTNNFVAGDSRMNLVIVKPGANGKISIFNSTTGSLTLTVDTVGYFRSGGTFFKAVDPIRPLDTRLATETIVAPGDFREVQIRGFRQSRTLRT
jgi:uncharacterized protein